MHYVWLHVRFRIQIWNSFKSVAWSTFILISRNQIYWSGWTVCKICGKIFSHWFWAFVYCQESTISICRSPWKQHKSLTLTFACHDQWKKLMFWFSTWLQGVGMLACYAFWSWWVLFCSWKWQETKNDENRIYMVWCLLLSSKESHQFSISLKDRYAVIFSFFLISIWYFKITHVVSVEKYLSFIV